MDDDTVFKALADESRRILLDALFRQDGQSLSELGQHLEMTRFGVMKHLTILEEAGLVTTEKVGRSKHHYLNPVPIQTVYERWVSKYAQPWAQAITGLQATLEGDIMGDKPAHRFQTYIRTTPEKLWQALTDGTFTRQYYLASHVQSDWQPGSDYQYIAPDGTVLIAGQVLESDPPVRLVTTFDARWALPEERGEPSVVTFEIEPVGAACKLTVRHEDITSDAPWTERVGVRWSQIMAGLKTLLETGEPLEIPPDAM